MKYQPKKIKIVPKEISELTTQGKKYTSLVMVNVRECGLDYMYYKHHIKDYGALSNISELVEIHKKLGDTGYNIACYICGEDYSLKQTRLILNIAQRYMGARLREVLDDLSRHFGYYKQKFY